MQQTSTFPYHALSVLVILAGDWSIYGLNMLTLMREPVAWVSLGSALSGIGVGLVEWRLRRAAKSVAVSKAALAAILVSAPLPLAGSMLFCFAVSWWLIAATVRLTKQPNH